MDFVTHSITQLDLKPEQLLDDIEDAENSLLAGAPTHSSGAAKKQPRSRSKGRGFIL